MAKDTLEALFAQVRTEASNRAKAMKWHDKSQEMRSLLMPCQVRLEADESRRVAVRAARRTGKSTGALLVIIIRCLEHAAANWVIVGLTRSSVKRNYWAFFQALNQNHELGIKFQHQELTATFPNGSRIWFVGADNASEAEKLRGGQFDGVLIDECKSYSTAMFEELIQDIIEPALLDRQGQLIVIGTPGDQLAGPFYLATCETPIKFYDTDGAVTYQSNNPYGTYCEVPFTWSLHPWTLQDNVTKFPSKKVRGSYYTLWDEALKLKQEKHWDDNHPTWRREYLGHWVANNLKYVYRLKPHVHSYTPLVDTLWGLPEVYKGQKITWKTVVGWDFGSKDGTAAVVWAFSDVMPGLWEVYSKRVVSTSDKPINISFIAGWYRTLEDEYGPFEGSVGDLAGLATMVVDTLASEHQVYIEAAEKREKNDHIELFNNDLDANLIRVINNSPLCKEMPANLWLARTIGTDKRKEDPETPNDLCDAALYAFRWCLHRLAKLRPVSDEKFTPQWWQLQSQEELKAAIKAAQTATQLNLDRDYWHDS